MYKILAKRFFILGTDDDNGGTEVPSGGDVWVLVVKNSQQTDSGIYVCEVNSNPIVRSFHRLSGKLRMHLVSNFVSTYYSF